uniref:PRA1 family protein n=1 Tax=Angiostrongylus cantonensis TaxID=6313 RepID=A0A0K0DQ08_ANGCA
LNVRLKDAFVRNVNYFSRNYGLFQICFPDSVPSDIGSFSKYGSPCIDNTDYFPVESVQENYSSQQNQRLYFMRANVVTYVLGKMSLFSLVINWVWMLDTKLFPNSSLVLLFAVSMACWHYVNYLERAVLEMPPFYKSWEPILKSTTRFNFGWSLVVAWVGILFILFASVFFICSASRLKVRTTLKYFVSYFC